MVAAPSKHVALVDPLWTGHHPTYLQALTRAFLAEGHQPVIFCPDPRKMRDLLDAEEQRNTSIVEYVWPPDTATQYSRRSDRCIAIQRLRHLEDTIRTHEREASRSVDMVFLACMDLHIGNFQTAWDWNTRFAWPFSGILFSLRHLQCPGRFRFLRKGPLDPDHVLRSRHCIGAGLLDEDMVHPLSRKLPDKLVLDWPDITDDTDTGPTDLSRHIRDQARGRRIISMLGSIAARKGMLELLAVFRQLPSDQFFLVVAGSVFPKDFDPQEWKALSAFLATPPENAFAHPHVVPDGAEFNALVRASDVLWLAYRDFANSSNMLTKSALFQVPVVVSDGHLMAHRVQRYSLGFSAKEGNIPGMAELLQQPALHDLPAAPAFQAGCRAYAEQHNSARLRAQIRRLCGTLPHPSSP